MPYASIFIMAKIVLHDVSKLEIIVDVFDKYFSTTVLFVFILLTISLNLELVSTSSDYYFTIFNDVWKLFDVILILVKIIKQSYSKNIGI